MQFRSDVVWSTFDFIAAAILLLSTGLSIELILRKIKTTKFRIMAFVVLVLFLFLIWAELAVGIFGSPFSGN
jgi:drug/metabolite transporter superfamily protein YnfA